ncbi:MULTISPECIES: BH0509 family protein [Priestia]|uniref:Transporter n=3 Tax=Priestia TaxID=2800373 RepID=A0A0H4KFS2_9BACI|nr:MULTISPECIES: BH0509 family protein [Priestia]AKO91124.1 transporter [Priestia filamentosa]KAB2492504.1 BH0509 family protein [Priestia endophytica]KYG35460.1 transporter [Priestia endophytica]MBG9810343.1 transporter [Priestia endophytica]MCM3540513.1 BH0509 family protein [Priestia endophytica]
MSRQERKNMIEFISRVRPVDMELFMYMTDADLEQVYNTTYFYHEEIAE